MTEGYLAVILHAHLPYVRHKQEGELAEDWFYEANTETYLPLLDMMNRLIEKGVDFRLTLSISPSLANMFADKLLQKRYEKHLMKLLELAEREIKRTENDSVFNNLAKMYKNIISRSLHQFTDVYHYNLIEAFRQLQETGCLELITSAATHGYLPLLYTEEAVKAQIQTGIQTYQHFFNREPAGIWLPECAFKPELDKVLANNNLRYFICSSHGLLYSTPRPRYGLYAPVYTPAGVAAFGRDIESSKQVWSSDEGYPGDFNYREFYRDIGFDLDYDYIKNYLSGGIRKQIGFKYYRITGKSNYKEPYLPEQAKEKAAEHAANFIFNRKHQLKYLTQVMDRKPVLVAPYDAELFGHWWFEGPIFLQYLFEKLHFDQNEIKPVNLTEYLSYYPKNQVAMPSESSWGYKGYHEVWLNGSNDWIYRHLHQAELTMTSLADRFSYLTDKKSPIYRSLNQLGRELMLAQSSDWPFIIKAGTMVGYAVMRIKRHLNHFWKLQKELQEGRSDWQFLSELEQRDPIFQELDFKIYCSEEGKRKEG